MKKHTQKRDMENYRAWKRKKYAENVEKERARKLIYLRNNKDRINELARIYYKNNKHKIIARQRLRNAVKKGEIIKPCQCSKCSSVGKLDAHHSDYNKPFDIIWLCRMCHLELHRGPRKEVYSDW